MAKNSCAPQRRAVFDHCKAKVKAAGLAGTGKVRVNKGGLPGPLRHGPVAVVYPEGTWYLCGHQRHRRDRGSHLKNGQVVERLLVPPELGR